MLSALKRSLFVVCFLITLLPFLSAEETCVYVDQDGIIRNVTGRDKLPAEYLNHPSTKCYEVRNKPKVKRPAAGGKVKNLRVPRNTNRYLLLPDSSRASSASLAAPDEVEIKGAERREDMASSVGRIELRWPRKIEKLFGRTPKFAMAEAARAVSRTLKQSGFNPELRKLDADWKVVFLDADLPSTQIPAYLIRNCHPGWMTPPANIYIVAQRAVSGCRNERTSSKIADSRLADVIIHEMGHVIEYHLLGRLFGGDRLRAEGFATWFQLFAAKQSPVLNYREVENRIFSNARRSIRKQPDNFVFMGSGEDYARASLYFHAIVKYRGGVRRLMEVYDKMQNDKLSFLNAALEVTHWSSEKLNEQAVKVLR